MAGDDDKDILDPGAGIRRWVAVPVEDEQQVANPVTSGEVGRKLSITREQSKDGMNLGREMDAQ